MPSLKSSSNRKFAHSSFALSARACVGLGLHDLHGVALEYLDKAKVHNGSSFFYDAKQGDCLVRTPIFMGICEAHIISGNSVDIFHIDFKNRSENVGYHIDTLTGAVDQIELNCFVVAGLTKLLASHVDQADPSPTRVLEICRQENDIFNRCSLQKPPSLLPDYE